MANSLMIERTTIGCSYYAVYIFCGNAVNNTFRKRAILIL